MPKATRADWAAQVPYTGIQDFPALLARLAEDGITISDVTGLQAALDALAGGGGGTVTWANVTGKPNFGSAAYVSVNAFVAAPVPKTYQSGVIDFVAAQRAYPVVFSPVMKDVPDIDTTNYISDGTSEEMFYNSIQSADENGFTLWLNTAPALSRGWCVWRARVP